MSVTIFVYTRYLHIELADNPLMRNGKHHLYPITELRSIASQITNARNAYANSDTSAFSTIISSVFTSDVQAHKKSGLSGMV